jgi:photosystem II stability/assembly factor-like uncharacterized protein
MKKIRFTLDHGSIALSKKKKVFSILRISLFLVFVLFNVTSCSDDNRPPAPSPSIDWNVWIQTVTDQTIRDIAHYEGNVYCVGDAGTIILGVDLEPFVQTPSGTSEDLNSISLYNNSNIWAAGNNGTILFNDGNSWKGQQSGITKNLNSISIIDDANVWAVGDEGAVLFYDGNSWASQAIGTDVNLNSIHTPSANHMWIVGDNGTIFFYDGDEWIEQSSGTLNNLNSISSFHGAHIWAVGNDGIILFFDNNTWTEYSSGTTENINSVSVLFIDYILAAGNRGTILHFNGEFWEKQNGGIDTNLFATCTDTSNFGGSGSITAGDQGVVLFQTQQLLNGDPLTVDVSNYLDVVIGWDIFHEGCTKGNTIPNIPKSKLLSPGTGIITVIPVGTVFTHCATAPSWLSLHIDTDTTIGDFNMNKGAGENWKCGVENVAPSYSISTGHGEVPGEQNRWVLDIKKID